MTPPTCVLYADDDADDREMMSDMFAEHPRFRLQTFDGGRSLLAYLEQSAPQDLCFLILDNNMPILSGYETLEAIRQIPAYSHTPAVIYTTGMVPSFREKVASLGATVVLKPTSLDAIRSAVRGIIATCTGRDASSG